MRFNTVVITIMMLMVLAVAGCGRSSKTVFDGKTLTLIQNLCHDQAPSGLIVYYLDGDCSFCIAKMKYIESKLNLYKGYRAVFIAKTENADVFNFNVAQVKISSCVYVDESHIFGKWLILNSIIQISRDGTITPDFEKTILKN